MNQSIALSIGISLLLGTMAEIVSADPVKPTDREWIAELRLDTGAEVWRREVRFPVGKDDIGPRLRSMHEVDTIRAGVFVLKLSAGESKCVLGLQRVCPKTGQHYYHVEEKHTALERIEQVRQIVGSKKIATKKYSALRYNESLYVYESATSQVLWEHHWQENEDLELTTDNERIYAATQNGVTAYEIGSARVLWSQPDVKTQQRTNIGQHEGKLLVRSGPTLAALSLATGKLLWEYHAGASGDPWPQLVGGKAYVVVREAQPRLWVCDVE